jgi:hypothetical protein
MITFNSLVVQPPLWKILDMFASFSLNFGDRYTRFVNRNVYSITNLEVHLA